VCETQYKGSGEFRIAGCRSLARDYLLASQISHIPRDSDIRIEKVSQNNTTMNGDKLILKSSLQQRREDVHVRGVVEDEEEDADDLDNEGDEDGEGDEESVEEEEEAHDPAFVNISHTPSPPPQPPRLKIKLRLPSHTSSSSNTASTPARTPAPDDVSRGSSRRAPSAGEFFALRSVCILNGRQTLMSNQRTKTIWEATKNAQRRLLRSLRAIAP
jgi:hypothetical protein